MVYHDNFYKDVLEAGELAKLAFFNDIVVGAVCCRVETAGSSGMVTTTFHHSDGRLLHENKCSIAMVFPNMTLFYR